MLKDLNDFEIFMDEVINYLSTEVDESTWNEHKNKYENTVNEENKAYLLLKYSEIHLNRYLEQK